MSRDFNNLARSFVRICCNISRTKFLDTKQVIRNNCKRVSNQKRKLMVNVIGGVSCKQFTVFSLRNVNGGTKLPPSTV